MGRHISETLISILGRHGLVRTLAHGLSARKSTKTTDGSTLRDRKKGHETLKKQQITGAQHVQAGRQEGHRCDE
jgi:hypothetical protein